MTDLPDTRNHCACGDHDLTEVDTITGGGIEHTTILCMALRPAECGAHSRILPDVVCALPAGHMPPHMHVTRPLRWWEE